MPEEDDTALEEPDAQIDNWEAEFTADLEAETEQCNSATLKI